jgi:hypothetical protein
MSRYVKVLKEKKELVYGCDDYGYFYLLFDDENGIPEDDFLIKREDRVHPEKFAHVLEVAEVDPKHISLVKQHQLF